MALKRFVIEPDGEVSPEKNDKIVDVYPSGTTGGHIFLVEREVPGDPNYEVGVTGVANVSNEYMVPQEDVHGVWAKRGEELIFVAFESKKGRSGWWPEGKVKNFVPDPSIRQQILDLQRSLAEAKRTQRRAERRAENAARGLRRLVEDVVLFRERVDKGQRFSQWDTRTAAGAALAEWWRQRASDPDPYLVEWAVEVDTLGTKEVHDSEERARAAARKGDLRLFRIEWVEVEK
jgi:hypothetical protein